MAQKPVVGLSFPVNDKGERSSSDAAKNIYAASFATLDPKLAEQVKQEKNWRFKYNKYIVDHLKLSLGSPEKALIAAKAGLDQLYKDFQFIRDGKTTSFEEALSLYKGSFQTGVVKGKLPKPSTFEIEVPYKGRKLKGTALAQQAYKWAEYGTIEPDTAEAIANVANNSKWADLSDKYFVLLGAGAAMGPFLVLMALGANVIALDLGIPRIWERLMKVAENSAGTLIFPLKEAQKDNESLESLWGRAGCDITVETPEICNWVKDLYPEREFVIGSYVYLDSEAFVRVSLACDSVIRSLCEHRKGTGVAFLCTPTDAHVIQQQAHKASETNYKELSWQNLITYPIRMMSSNMLVKNAQKPVVADNGEPLYWVDALIVPQGPNYALAKRLQHWRSVLARSQGHLVSTHIAPSTATVSVVKNKQFAWAYDGMPFFKPMEIFEQDTSNAVMAALLINDLRNSKSPANPTYPLKNPYELFSYSSFHGGAWRLAYKFGTIGEVAVIVHFVKVLWIYIVLAIVGLFLLKRLF